MTKKGLSANQIKLIAAVSMLIDHVGYFLFPTVTVFRIIGRLAFPIFAFFVAEGCRYTKNRLRYWGKIGVCAVAFQVVTILSVGGFGAPISFDVIFSVPLNIFFTFAVAILICYLFDFVKSKKIGGFLLFLLVLFAFYALSRYVEFDYGFVGMLVPLSVFVFEEKWSRFLCFSLTLLALSATSGWNVQYFCLLAVPILSFYGGHYGSKKYKYWFYVFYPAHLILIYFVGFLLK